MDATHRATWDRYASACFKALTGDTLKACIRSRRLALALDRLLTTKLRVLDVAVLAGFESQEAFARAFKQACGLTPQQYRRIGRKHLFLKKLQIDAAYLQHLRYNMSTEALPQGMVSLDVPAATYATFAHRGPAQHYGPDLEIYGADYHPTREDSVFHDAIPVTLEAG